MPASTPIATSKTAALARVLDNVPRGYTGYTQGIVKRDKVESLARKFHRLYSIGATPAQRLTRKRHGLANSILVVYAPDNSETAAWLLLCTPGDGLESERLHNVTDRTRLQFVGYELVRRPGRARSGVSWTWRRPAAEMREHFATIAELASTHKTGALAEFLQRIARQPGFHGVRAQSWDLVQEALKRGYNKEVPHLFYVEKVNHGDRLIL